MENNTTSATNDVPCPFIQRYPTKVTGVLHGWDRIRLQGTLRTLYYGPVMARYLFLAGVLWKDYKDYVTGITHRVCQAARDWARREQRPMVYLPSCNTDKEQVALQAQRKRPVRQGLVAVLSCVEQCRTWFARGNRQTRELELKMQRGKCLHLYFYYLHEEVGWLSVRLQTWFPFLIQICLNGREWLARQMDAEGLAYRRQDNTFSWVADPARAQALLDQQHQTDWPKLLHPLVKLCHPLHSEIMGPLPRDYYWTAAESEYACDVMFGNRATLQRLYPRLVRHAVLNLSCEQILRYMRGSSRGRQHAVVHSDLRRGPDGIRLKHWVNRNSLKAYDKGSNLRGELTMNDTRDFKVWRRSENHPEQEAQWRILRRGVADLKRRAEVSRAGVDRYLAALAAVEVATPLAEEAAAVCRPIRKQKRRYRALNPFGQADAQLLLAANRGEFAANGLRNRDLRAHLYPRSRNALKRRRQMAATGRRLSLLRAHGLLRKVSRTHRYMVTDKGRRIITALLTARQASTDKLIALAA